MAIQKILLWYFVLAFLCATISKASSDLGFTDQFEKAQTAFASGDVAKAKAEWDKFINVAKSQSLSREQRPSLHFAYLRLAQLCQNDQGEGNFQAKDCDHILISALDLEPNLQPDQRLFPPPLIERYQALALIQLRSSNSGTSGVVQNKPTTAEIALGSEFKDLKINQGSKTLDNPEHFNQLEFPNKMDKPQAWYKNKYLWIGASVVAAGIIITENSKDKSKSVPTTHEGF